MFQILIRKGLNTSLVRLSRLGGKLLPAKLILEKVAVRFQSLSIETTNHCNAKCVFCAYKYLKRPKGIMDESLFSKIIEEYADIGGGELNLTPMVGDPLMDPKIIDRILFAREYKAVAPIYFFTNGILLDKAISKGLLDSGIHRIIVSLIGSDRQSYKRLSGVDRWDKVISNIICLLELNNAKADPVDIRIGIRTDLSMKDLSANKTYKKIAALTDKIDYQYHFHNWGGVVQEEEPKGGMKSEETRKTNGPCFVLYRGPKILWNGDASACMCININGDEELLLGNIKNHHLIHLWQGDKMRNLRRQFFAQDLPKTCRSCSHYNSVSVLLDLHHRKLIKECYNNYISSNYFLSGSIPRNSST